MPKKRIHRYWIEIKDAKGSIVFFTSTIWDGNERRLAIAKITRLDGGLEDDLSLRQRSERNAGKVASLAPLTEKKHRH